MRMAVKVTDQATLKVARFGVFASFTSIAHQGLLAHHVRPFSVKENCHRLLRYSVTNTTHLSNYMAKSCCMREVQRNETRSGVLDHIIV